ncbi:TIM-barrel domain-containing protein [Oricola cellulosilytica]|uniref:Alpha-glucosidase n=1 Tax=Oricola cellulosilytica TaxID=1429082 RepID=A0A4R0P912_9HYPH|nr:TIM-barrel domain-containing protein [Oricola cellulosilytica]TCD13358.1 alpha-glucosidase [Oricola cellulosilytica]
MRRLKNWQIGRRLPAGIELALEGGSLMRLQVLDKTLFRISLVNRGLWRLDRTWAIAPQGDTPWEGRARDDLSGFPCPAHELDAEAERITLATKDLRLLVGRPLRLTWQALIGGTWKTFAEDRPTGAYLLGRTDHAAEHFLLRAPGERIYGLGEKAGPLERSGRRYEMRNLDALGYDAQTTDPLYKHIPFTLTRTETAGSYSLYYDTAATAWFDLGNERDNYHPPYRAFRTADGDLDYYMRWSPDIMTLVREQARMTGGTAFPPRWSLGYSGSTMAYTDAPDAESRLAGFLDELDRYDIPCDSFHLSSGYTAIGNKRYVFHWNRDRFPDPDQFTARFNTAGVRLIANIKPCLLNDHPRRAEAEEQHLFITDSETGEPESSVFWDDEGSHLDFTNPATVDWWKLHVRRELLDRGIAATWNDNNEFEVWNREARCAGFGRPLDISQIRPIQALLMTRASDAAQRAHAPDRRPYLVTRSGGTGIQRYAQTWTGDNHTDWETLRWNIRMGLGLSLSGFFNIGHDTGGFAGPQPGPELLLRWVQNGIFHPRFTIHSWNADNSATEPWTHPEVTPLVAAAVRLRYRLLPYLYTCLWRAAAAQEPILRPLFLDHEDDPASFADSDEFLLGPDLLVATVVEAGATRRRLRLPVNATGWVDFHTGVWHSPGSDIDMPVTLASVPLFVRAGSVLPLSIGARRATPEAETARELAIYPAPGDFAVESLCYDDRDTTGALEGDYCLTRLHLSGVGNELRLEISQSGRREPPHPTLRLHLATGDSRRLTSNGAPVAASAEVSWRT